MRDRFEKEQDVATDESGQEFVRKSRGHVVFDSSCPTEFESLVSETLGTSDFIEVEHMDDGLVIHEVPRDVDDWDEFTDGEGPERV